MKKSLKLFIAIVGLIAYIFIPHMVGLYVLQPDPVGIPMLIIWLIGLMVTCIVIGVVPILLKIAQLIYQWIMSDNW